MAPLLSTPGLVSPWKKKIGEWVQVWWEGPSLPTPAAADLPFPRPRPSPPPTSRWPRLLVHTCRPCPLQGGTLALHPAPLPTEYEQQPAAVPSMEKKRTVYQMALSKKPRHGSPMPPSPRLWGCCMPFCPCAHQSPVSSALGALEPRALHAITVPPTLLCSVIPGLCLLGWCLHTETGTGPHELCPLPQGHQGSSEARRLSLSPSLTVLTPPQTNWMRSWLQLNRPSAPVRVLGLGASRPWASTGPKDSLPLR